MKPKTMAWIVGSTVGALLLMAAVRAFGQSPAWQSVGVVDFVRVVWDPNSEPDLAGYRVRAGTNSGQPLWVKDVGLTTEAAVSVSNHAELFLTVTAYNESGLESDPSNEIRIGGRPAQVQGVRESITVTTVVIVTNVIRFP